MGACFALALAGGALTGGSVQAATSDTPFGAVTTKPPGNEKSFGYRMAAARYDYNGDGANDVFVANADKGRVYLLSGKDLAAPRDETQPLRVFQDPEGKDGRFGQWIFSVLGDVNGDAQPDIAVGDPTDDAVWVMSGKTAKVIQRLDNPSAFPWDRYSERIGRAGDITGDGASEVIVGAAGYDVPEGCGRYTGVTPCSHGQGRAYIFDGATGALVRTLELPAEDVPFVKLYGASEPTRGCRPNVAGGCNFGNAVQGPGDVDKDGTPDQLVAANLLNDGQGRMYLFSGKTGKLIRKIDSPEPDLDLNGPTNGDDDAFADFGFQDAAPLSPGDVNGDGHADVYGASMDQDGPAGRSQGKAWVFSGEDIAAGDSATVFSTALYDLNDPTPQRGNFGWSMDKTDDNKDGVPDLYIGQAQHHAGQGSGGTYVFDGAKGSPLKTLDMPASCPEDGILGWSLAAPGDLNGDSEADYVAGAPFMDIPFGNDPGWDRGLVFGFVSNPPSSLPTACSDLQSEE